MGDDPDQKSLLDVIEYHNKSMLDTLTWGTAKKYYTTKKYVAEFLKEKKGTTDIYLTQLNYKFLTEFEMFLRGHVAGRKSKAMRK